MTIVLSHNVFCLAIQLAYCTAQTLMKGENWLCSSGISLEETPLQDEILSIAFFQLSPKLWLRERCLVVSPGNWRLCYPCLQARSSLHCNFFWLQNSGRLLYNILHLFLCTSKCFAFCGLRSVKINWSITNPVSVFEWIINYVNSCFHWFNLNLKIAVSNCLETKQGFLSKSWLFYPIQDVLMLSNLPCGLFPRTSWKKVTQCLGHTIRATFASRCSWHQMLNHP